MGNMWGSDVPLIGKSITRFGKVGQILATPCTPSPELWVWASWKGIATAIWSLGKPSAVSEHGSPTSMSVFGKHGRTNTKNQPGPRYRWNGEIMPGPEFQWPQGEGWAMWKVPVMLIRTAGWYLLVYDALAKGVLAWTSETYKYAGCPVPGYPWMHGVEADHLLFPNEEDTLGAFSSYQNTGVPFGGGIALIPGGATYTAFMSVSSAPWGVMPANFAPASGRIRNTTTGQIWDGSPPDKGGGSVNRSVAIARAQTTGAADQQIVFEVKSGNGFCIVDGSTVYVQLFPFENMWADP